MPALPEKLPQYGSNVYELVESWRTSVERLDHLLDEPLDVVYQAVGFDADIVALIDEFLSNFPRYTFTN